MPLSLQSQSIAFPPGDADLLTTRIELELVGELAAAAEQMQISYEDDNYSDRVGWQEVVVSAENIQLVSSTAATEDVSDALTNYPDDATNMNVSSAQLTVARAAGESVSVAAQEVEEPPFWETDRFAELINEQLNNPMSVFFVLLAALGYGAAHALTPGHGKTIVAAYLVGSRGTTKHALFLGLTTTITHTAGVFFLGFLTLFASRYILPEQISQWLGVLSGLLVIGIGWTMLRMRITGRDPLMAAVDTDHAHDFSDGGLVHSHGGGPAHSHEMPNSVSWKSLLALGVSGGLIPCPSALVLMLAAIGLNRVGLGLILIIVFSTGLAGVLTLIGILWVKGREWMERSEGGFMSRLTQGAFFGRILPAASAAFIILVGVVITYRAVVEAGVL